MTSTVLTASEKRHLFLLCTAEAFDFESAASAYTLSTCDPQFGVDTGALSNLEGLGLCLSRVKGLGRGHQMTVFWLTDAGFIAASELMKGRAA